jgi:hypothetical protein
MTSAALIFAQIPLVLKLEEGSESQAPLAVVVMGGMVTSTFLALVFVPSMYTIVDDLQNLIGRLFRRLTGSSQPPTSPTDSPDSPDSHDTPDAPVRKEETMDGQTEKGGLAPSPRRRLTPAGAASASAVTGVVLIGALLLSACNTPAGTATAAPAAARRAWPSLR